MTIRGTFVRPPSARRGTRRAPFGGFAWLVLAGASAAHAFTQSGLTVEWAASGIPMGHEWVTRIGAFEVVGDDPLQKDLNDPNDPRKKWTRGLAKNPKLDAAAQSYVQKLKQARVSGSDARYQAAYVFIYSAIIGERWVDIGGYSIAASLNPWGYDCWGAAAQEPAELQQDHFMRRYDDSDGEGAVQAATRAQQRFADHFVAAATATEQDMTVWDGGSTTERVRVNSNFFLFGRAAHLFQDAFSSEHTVRTETPDNFERVRQVKSYLCATGAEQHTHNNKELVSYLSGDVIWIPQTTLGGWKTYKASNMKNVALVATEATRDLWAAFLRTMAMAPEERRARATSEAQTLVDNWLAFDADQMRRWYDAETHRIEDYVLTPGQTGNGQTQQACLQSLPTPANSQKERVEALLSVQRICVFNAQATPGYADLNDPYLRLPFNWQWKFASWQVPSADWTLPTLAADSGKGITVRTAEESNLPMITADGRLASGKRLGVGDGGPVRFVLVPSDGERRYLRARDDSSLLTYVTTDGELQLFNALEIPSPETAAFWVADRSTCAAPKWTLENVGTSQYLWLDDATQQVQVSAAGDPLEINANWILEGLSSPGPAPAATCPASSAGQ